MKARTKDGAEIFYEVYDFTDPWKPSETILLHHGLSYPGLSRRRCWPTSGPR